MSETPDQYVIGGAGLPVSSTEQPFDRPYPPREFQSEALDWIHGEDTAPVATLAAPTGAGKTDVIAALGAASTHLLCLYPTNALIDAQQDALEASGLTVETVTGETLSGRGQDRSEQLLNIAQAGNRTERDVLITNPDILQAVIQDMYFSPGSRLLEFYSQFDAAVYDEFHYYDALAASGLLTQIKILSERGSYLTRDGKQLPKFLLSSATPDTKFIGYVRDDLELDIRDIRSELVALDIGPNPNAPVPATELVYGLASSESESESLTTRTEQLLQHGDEEIATRFGDGSIMASETSGSRFRYPMLVRRHSARVNESFEAIADQLATTISDAYTGGDPVAAVIFNSAGRSNDFQRFLAETRPSLAADVTKDNGYDTNADRSLPEETAALNTTSKGEVGLDFDIRHLVMVKPFTATQFIQRIGRAGRQSPAIVDIYGFKDPTWPGVQSYPRFLKRVTDTLTDTELRQRRLRNLTGMRAAYALQVRLDDDRYHNEEIFEDFRNFPTQSRWGTFLSDLEEAADVLEENTDTWTGPQLDHQTSRLIRGVIAARDGLESLRGRTISHPVTYPRGAQREQTEYSLASALAYYGIESVDRTHVIHLTADQSPGPLRGYFPGEPNGGDGLDLMQARHAITSALRDGYTALIDSAGDLETASLDEETLRSFFALLPLSSAMTPIRLRAGHYDIEYDPEHNEVTNVASRQ